ncbi:hypothetical protein [Pontiella sulfatireligans]|uniref:Stress-response A/B barrel domain-containing protein n=1 Tax=Pontiella sulfatireligans TaxID=2750658 RepID=A0A6C2UHC3_9BACT|nr:hypothetical protein [Pontiella sulfatireligans]VGO18811.1 hypothetical protein SCARR_00864 [Pontiella sulfatireligans]
MKFKMGIILSSVLACLSVSALSPYENYLLSGRQTHVMLFASAKDGRVEALQSALKTLNEKKAIKAFKKEDITNLSFFSTEVQGKLCFMVYFDYDGSSYLDAVKAFESVEQTEALKPLLVAHPRAAQDGNSWLQMEWIHCHPIDFK